MVSAETAGAGAAARAGLGAFVIKISVDGGKIRGDGEPGSKISDFGVAFVGNCGSKNILKNDGVLQGTPTK